MVANVYKSNAFTLLKGGVNLTSGTFSAGSIFLCTEDGDLTVTWSDGTTSVISCVVGDAFRTNKEDARSMAVTSGTFHVS